MLKWITPLNSNTKINKITPHIQNKKKILIYDIRDMAKLDCK